MTLPPHFNFAKDVIDEMAGSQRAGLLFVDAVGHRRDYTFAEIAEQSQRYAAVLRSLGVNRGDRVLLCTSASGKALFTLLALQRLGAVAVPAPGEADARRIGGLAVQHAIDAVVAERARRPLADALAGTAQAPLRTILIGETREGWSRLDTLTASAKPFEGIEMPPAETAYLFETGEWSYGALREMRATAQDALQAGAADRVWIALPAGSAVWTSLVQAPWWSGAATVVHEGAHDPPERLDLLRELDVTILCQTADAYAAQVDLPDAERFRIPRLRRCIAVEEVPSGVQRRWSERFGLSIVQTEAPAPALL